MNNDNDTVYLYGKPLNECTREELEEALIVEARQQRGSFESMLEKADAKMQAAFAEAKRKISQSGSKRSITNET